MGGAAEVSQLGADPWPGTPWRIVLVAPPRLVAPGEVVAKSFEAAACMVPVSWGVTAHFVAWGYMVYRVYADVHHRGRPDDAHSHRQA